MKESKEIIIAHNNISHISHIKPLVFTNKSKEYKTEKIINEITEYMIAKGKTGTSEDSVTAKELL